MKTLTILLLLFFSLGVEAQYNVYGNQVVHGTAEFKKSLQVVDSIKVGDQWVTYIAGDSIPDFNWVRQNGGGSALVDSIYILSEGAGRNIMSFNLSEDYIGEEDGMPVPGTMVYAYATDDSYTNRLLYVHSVESGLYIENSYEGFESHLELYTGNEIGGPGYFEAQGGHSVDLGGVMVNSDHSIYNSTEGGGLMFSNNLSGMMSGEIGSALEYGPRGFSLSTKTTIDPYSSGYTLGSSTLDAGIDSLSYRILDTTTNLPLSEFTYSPINVGGGHFTVTVPDTVLLEATADYFKAPNGVVVGNTEHQEAGTMRYNSTSNELEYYNGTEWGSIGGGSGGGLITAVDDNFVISDGELRLAQSISDESYLSMTSIGPFETGTAEVALNGQENRVVLSAGDVDLTIEKHLGGFTISNAEGTIAYIHNNGRKFKQHSGSLTDGAPTVAEISSIYTYYPEAGAQLTIKDTDGTGLLYFLEFDGTDWFYTVMTKAL